MDDDGARRAVLVGAVVIVLAVLVWLGSFGGAARARAQFEIAAGDGAGPAPGEDPVRGPHVLTGICPDGWRPHVPTGAHLGRHRMYRHPAAVAPNITEPQQVAWDWLYSPPSEGTLLWPGRHLGRRPRGRRAATATF